MTPDTSLARLGGDDASRRAISSSRRSPTIAVRTTSRTPPDDVELGPVDAEWSVEEFYAVYGDDDKEFVGTLSPTGFFTPAAEGPNPKRKFSRNNYGDVWVVATYKGETGKDGKPLTAKSYLVVAVPLYVRWDQPEVAQVNLSRSANFTSSRAAGGGSCTWCRAREFSNWTSASHGCSESAGARRRDSAKNLSAIADEDVIDELHQAHMRSPADGFAEPAAAAARRIFLCRRW